MGRKPLFNDDETKQIAGFIALLEPFSFTMKPEFSPRTHIKVVRHIGYSLGYSLKLVIRDTQLRVLSFHLKGEARAVTGPEHTIENCCFQGPHSGNIKCMPQREFAVMMFRLADADQRAVQNIVDNCSHIHGVRWIRIPWNIPYSYGMAKPTTAPKLTLHIPSTYRYNLSHNYTNGVACDKCDEAERNDIYEARQREIMDRLVASIPQDLEEHIRHLYHEYTHVHKFTPRRAVMALILEDIQRINHNKQILRTFRSNPEVLDQMLHQHDPEDPDPFRELEPNSTEIDPFRNLADAMTKGEL